MECVAHPGAQWWARRGPSHRDRFGDGGTPHPAKPQENVVTVPTGVFAELQPKLTESLAALQLGYMVSFREFLGYAATAKDPPEAVPQFRIRQAIGINMLTLGESLLLTVGTAISPLAKITNSVSTGPERTLFMLLTPNLVGSSDPK